MKAILTLMLMVALNAQAFSQAQGVYTHCPDEVVFSQNYSVTAYWFVSDAWDKGSTIAPTLENYSATAPFNSVRFFGAWVLGSGFWYPASHPDPTEPFIIEIYDQNPVTGNVSPVYSETLVGNLTKIGYADYANTSGSRVAWNEGMYQVDIALNTDITVLNGWISIRNVNDPQRPSNFGICFDWAQLSDIFYKGSFTQQGGGYTGSWGTPIKGNIFLCLSHNGVALAGSPVVRFDQALDNWDGITPAWQEAGTSSAGADDFHATGGFNKLTTWGGFVLGSSSSCTVNATENFQVEFYTGDPSATSPDQTLTVTGSLTPTTSTFYELGGQTLYRVDIDLGPTITLTNGWVRILNVNPAGRTCRFAILNNNTSINGTYLDENLMPADGALFFTLSSPCPTGFASAGPDFTVHLGYPPLAGDTIHASGGIWYDWDPITGMRQTSRGNNNYLHRPDEYVEPSVTTTYMVTVTDANGCRDEDAVTVTVIDVRCGKKLDMVLVCSRGKTLCVAKSKVAALLAGGATLGPCTRGTGDYFVDDDMISEEVSLHAAPNPVLDACEIVFEQPDDGPVTIRVIDMTGRVFSTVHDGFLVRGSHRFQWTRPASAASMYLLTARKADQVEVIRLITQ